MWRKRANYCHISAHVFIGLPYVYVCVFLCAVVRDTVLALFKTNVNCTACHRQAPLPKTTLTRRTILATYPNSRWQMDLKKLPSVRGYEYCCNVVDCFSRFAMGGPIKSKSAKDVCNVIVSCMYRYGAPRILQTDNGREFNNSSLAAVMDEMRALKINGRPYHPQSQGRVERLNQTLANFLRRDLQKEPDWPSRLEYFYFTYNCRYHLYTYYFKVADSVRQVNKTV
eukprot:scpid58375/ scgid5968/ Pol polyprotein; Reverse transcriptase/ribonuclease H; Integrase